MIQSKLITKTAAQIIHFQSTRSPHGLPPLICSINRFIILLDIKLIFFYCQKDEEGEKVVKEEDEKVEEKKKVEEEEKDFSLWDVSVLPKDMM